MYQAQRYFRALELNKVLEKLSEQANCDDSKQMALSLTPLEDYAQVKALMQKTADAYMLSARYTSPALHKLKNCEAALKKAEKGSNLSLRELLDVSAVLHNIRSVKDWRKRCEGESTSLDVLFELLMPNRELENTIDNAILSEEELADSASRELGDLRRKINQAKLRVREKLDAIIKSPTQSKYLQETLVTMRDGRFVVPVKSEHRSEIKGLVHDTSASGATIFIEPMAVVEANNEIRVLQAKEKREIERIIAELSVMVGSFAEPIIQSYRALVEIDLYFAKASLAYKMKATVPNIVNSGEIDLKRARHPLIDPEKVVPTDVNLGKDFNTLVITGPNTGGKTVSLKTVGLFTLMGQAGLHIPAFDGSHLRVFHEVYADIGDEQSIEQSLSTFSSHMTNTVSILKRADKNTLALFDELGAGTDPVEGAALAISILDNLLQRNVTAMATTHYSELKIYALSTEHVENASCEFDVESLQPTYRLLIGVPGKSNAFAISSKLGISDEIIEKAKSLVDEDSKSFEDVVTGLESTRKELEEERAKAAAYREEIERQRKKLAEKNERIDKAKEKILRRANEEANEILQKAKDMADDSIRKYNKWMDGGKGNVSDMERQRSAIREQLKKTGEKLATKQKGNRPKTAPGKLSIGDLVMVHSMGVKGTVMSLPNTKGKCFVQMGIMRSEVNADDLELLEEETLQNRKEQLRERSGAGKIKMMKSLHVSSSINLIGKTVDEAIALLDKYLDDAYLAKLHQITIIHGVGTGALRNAVQAHLKKSKYIKTYRMGEYGEGGYGVTVAEFK